MPNDVRDRSREILRAELADAAATFCVDHGFEDATAEQIARGIGISRATFFRYFTSKEDAVVTAVRDASARTGSFADSVATTIDDAAPGTSVWTLLHQATSGMATQAGTRGDPLRARIRMITEVPALKRHVAAQRDDDEAALAAVLRPHLHHDHVAHALAAATLSALDLAWQEWARTPGSELGPLLESYFAAFAGLTSPEIG